MALPSCLIATTLILVSLGCSRAAIVPAGDCVDGREQCDPTSALGIHQVCKDRRWVNQDCPATTVCHKPSGACRSPDEDGTTADAAAPETAGPPTGPCATVGKPGDWLRFTKLAFTSLSGGTPGLLDALNGTWQADVAKKELNVLGQILGVDGHELTLELMGGARVGKDGSDSYCVVSDTRREIKLPFTDQGLGPSGAIEFRVTSGSREHPKYCAAKPARFGVHALPLEQVRLTITCDGQKRSGTLTGVLAAEDLAALCVCVVVGEAFSDDACAAPSGEFNAIAGCDGCNTNHQPMNALIQSLNGAPLSHDCQDAGGGAAACVEGSFEAEPLAVVPPDC